MHPLGLICVAGAGPAGLMAAETLADAGHQVVIAEAKPSAGRKFLMAGKSGLNLTKDEPLEAFRNAYFQGADELAPMLQEFGPPQVQDWAQGLGQQVFTGSSGRVFPKVMKASPLLRTWLSRMGVKGVSLRRNWRLTGLDGHTAQFDTPEGPQQVTADALVLALGGASWPRLGSDGAWSEMLRGKGVAISPFRPSNVGVCIDWSPQMARHFGQPVKTVALSAGKWHSRGECVISDYGLEGSGIYALTPALREGGTLTLDLKPDWTADQVRARLAQVPPKTSLTNILRKALRLAPTSIALIQEFARTAPDLATSVKALNVPFTGLRPMEQAISVAGGVAWDALDDKLMLRSIPGVFCAGEMIDWDAPTGGYLLTACLATGRRAGLGAAQYLSGR